MKTPSKATKAHPNFEQSDFDYLSGKGWSEAEIVTRWTEERAAGKGPLGHAKLPDLVGYLNGQAAA